MPNLLSLVSAFLMLFSSIATFAQGPTKKPEPTTEYGHPVLITCTRDTNAPARFAVVTLERIPEEVCVRKERRRGTAMNPTATTDMEGRLLSGPSAGGPLLRGRETGRSI